MSARILIPLHILFTIVLCTPARADSFAFSTVPGNGVVSGPPGSLVGWGYSITNMSLTQWLVTISLNAGSFLNGSPSLIFDFPTVAPGATVAVPFASLGHSGLYELLWDTTAPAGFLNSGEFILSAEWWTGDPFAGGTFIETAEDQAARYTASVSPVSEPSMALVTTAALAVIALLKRNAKQTQV